jgi:hypothetical protein
LNKRFKRYFGLRPTTHKARLKNEKILVYGQGSGSPWSANCPEANLI